MMNPAELTSVPSDPPVPFTDQLRLAVAAYLTRFKGSSREHTELQSLTAWVIPRRWSRCVIDGAGHLRCHIRG
jgi:hypothetical protein